MNRRSRPVLTFCSMPLSASAVSQLVAVGRYVAAVHHVGDPAVGLLEEDRLKLRIRSPLRYCTRPTAEVVLQRADGSDPFQGIA
jgi:hypothetical protein